MLGCSIWVNAILNYSDVSTVIYICTQVCGWYIDLNGIKNKNIVEYSYHVGIKNYKILEFFVPKCYHH